MVLDRIPITPTGKIDRQQLPVPNHDVIKRVATYVAPRSPLEQQLAKLWAQVLGLPRVGVLDNFFALGGNSLQAVQLMAHIDQQLGRELHLNTLWFDATTVAAQARLLEKDVGANAKSPVIVMQEGGSGRPLFCLHTIGGGNLFHYESIVKHLGDTRPIYGLQAKGIGSLEKPDTSVEEMASYCIQAMQQIQPSGPYLLCGFSSAGVVGYEMSRQLHAKQHKALLFMLDTVSARHRRTFKQNVLRWLELFRQGSYREVQEMLYFHFLNLLRMPHRRHLVALGESHRWAIWTYQPQPHTGNVVYFEADHELAHSRDPHQAWQELVRGSFTLEKISGAHGSITSNPHVKVLAGSITSHIAKFEPTSGQTIAHRWTPPVCQAISQ